MCHALMGPEYIKCYSSEPVYNSRIRVYIVVETSLCCSFFAFFCLIFKKYVLLLFGKKFFYLFFLLVYEIYFDFCKQNFNLVISFLEKIREKRVYIVETRFIENCFGFSLFIFSSLFMRFISIFANKTPIL